MKNLFRALIAVCAMSMASGVGATVITEIANNDFGSRYLLLESTNWEVAQDEAESLGGNLVTIESQEENDWIFEQFTFFGGVYRDLWLGLNDSREEGTMEWVSTSTATYRNFQLGEPNNAGGTQDYVIMWAGPIGAHISGWVPGKWDDFTGATALLASYTLRNGGTRTVHGLVEVQQPVPEPTTTALLALGLFGVGAAARRRLN